MFKKSDVQDMYSLSPMQEGMLFHHLKDEKSSAYFEQTSCRINGEIDTRLIEQAFNQLIERYDILRTVFVYKTLMKPRQVVLKKKKAAIHVEDISSLDGKKESYLQDFKRKDREKGFDLAKDLLIRYSIFKTDEKSYAVVWSFHHIIMDGWCVPILNKELLAIYNSLKKGTPVKLSSVPPYSRYIKWLEKQDKERGLNYWRSYLQHYKTRSGIPGLKTNKEREYAQYNQKDHRFSINSTFTNQLNCLSEQNNVTVSTIFQAVWGILLQKYNNTDDVVFGTVVSGRPAEIPGIETMMGLFINTIPLRVRNDSTERFRHLLRRVQREINHSKDYDYIPLAEIQSTGLLKQDLFNHIVIFENYPLEKQMEQAGPKQDRDFSINNVEVFEQTNYHLHVMVVPADELYISVKYNSLGYAKQMIEKIGDHLLRIIQQVIENPGIRVREIQIITESEKRRLLYDFNQTETGYPEDKTLHDLFEEQAEQKPDYTALIGKIHPPPSPIPTPRECGNRINPPENEVTITYGQLNRESNQLAHMLRAKGVQPGTLVGVMLDRSLEMMIALFAILKAGGAYLPIDPRYPAERIRYLLVDSGAKVLVSGRPLAKEGEISRTLAPGPICLDIKAGCQLPLHSGLPWPNVPVASPAYVIYTSGSTGKPKGVVVNHNSAVNILTALQRLYPLKKPDTYLLKTSITFDVSVTELFGWFFAGGRLAVLDPNKEKDPGKILSIIARLRITHINFVPSMFNAFLDVLTTENIIRLAGLRYIFLCGEALLSQLVNRFRRFNTSIVIENIYGPTESTIYASKYSLSQWQNSSESENNNIPIGTPLPNIKLYILDKYYCLQPMGIVGELCIAGVGLARGYLNRPGLTAEKFCYQGNNRKGIFAGKRFLERLPDKIPGKPRKNFLLIYKTGDLASWMPDGNIEFLGRIDHQIKIRGFRVELGEIENQLLKHDSVKEALVIDRMDHAGHKYLCAYIVRGDTNDPDPAGPRESTETGQQYSPVINTSELKEFLSGKLPGYMIPSCFIQLEEMPLLPNGKINRKLLPEPGENMNTAPGIEYEAPGNELEETLARIWQEVLGVKNPGINDNFFAAGGHSLKVMALAARIFKELSIEIPISKVFECSTIQTQANFIKHLEKGSYLSIQPGEKREYYELSPPQNRLYIQQQIDRDSIAYNMPGTLELLGDLDRETLQETVLLVIDRHESLRTSFHVKDNKPIQRIHHQVSFGPIDTGKGYDIDGEPEVHIITNFIRPFDLSRAPLLRMKLKKIEPQRHLLMIDMHHIITDAVSRTVLIDDFMHLYAGKKLSPIRIQYKDFSQWQTNEQQKKVLEKQETYWLRQFSGEIPVMDLPADFNRPGVQRFEGETVRFKLSHLETRGLKLIARENRATLYMVLLSLFTLLLAKISSQETVVIGTPLAGRRSVDLEKIIGMFINLLALKNDPRGEKTFNQFLNEVKTNTMAAFENQDFPFDELVDKLGIKRNPSRNPLFDTVFVFQNVDSEELTIPGLKIKSHAYENRTAKFDLTFEAAERDRELVFNWEYSTVLFKNQTIRQWIHYFKQLVQAVLNNNNSEARIDALEIISEAEKHRLLYDFNKTAAQYPRDKLLQQLFVEQAERLPDHIALVGPSTDTDARDQLSLSVSYKKLNTDSQHLAGVLKGKGIKSDWIVAIMLEPSIDMTAAIIAVLKAGGAYMPVDPECPPERIKFMLSDSKSPLIITTGTLAKKKENLKGWEGEKILLEDFTVIPESPAAPVVKNESAVQVLQIPQIATSLAYIIYTSGTTGKPKGVLIEHGNVVRLLFNDQFQFDFSHRDVWTMFHSYCFDFSVWEMYGALLYGGELIIIPGMTARDTAGFLTLMKQKHVTVLNQTPPAFYNLAEEEMKKQGKELHLKYVIFGGEALKPMKLKQWKARYPGTRLINMYGITETTVHVTFKEISDAEIQSGISNIGKPIPTLSTYIMNKKQRLQPIGSPGELCVAGAGIGRGYLNRPDLTKEKFLENPYKPGEKLYRSGDLARIQDNGEIEYLGRIDNQVKIRGFRIELGEIESKLLKYEGIKEALVLVKEDQNQDKYLCAYLVSHRELIVSDLRKHLLNLLPQYMVPAYFVTLERLPLTPNGKVDRSALPRPENSSLRGDKEYAAPRNDIEEKLAQTWKQVLARDTIGIYDNFFELGGDSIKTIQIASRMNQAGYKVEMKDIFQYPQIAELAPFVKPKEQSADQSVVSGAVPLTPVQRWFFENNVLKPHHFNQAVMFFSETGFEEEAVKQVFEKLQQHHDALRMTYTQVQGKMIQVNQGLGYPLSLQVFDYRNQENAAAALESKANDIQASIDLQSGPLMKLALFRLNDGDRLLIVLHHLVVDGVSWRILFEDIETLYQQYQHKKPLALPLKTDSFKLWSERLCQYANSPSFLQEKSYWLELERTSATSAPVIKKDLHLEENYVKDEESMSFTLDEECTRLLLSKVNDAFGTEINDILLTALGLAVKGTFGHDHVLIALEGHGREDILKDVDISRTIGWFTSLYPVLLPMEHDHDPGRQVKEIKERLRQVPNKGIGYGIMKYLTETQHKKEMDFKLNPRISFNYFGQFDADVRQMSFGIARESFGQTRNVNGQREFDIDVTGIIASRQLKISLGYNKKHFKPGTIQTLLENYKTGLEHIISYCASRKERQLTPGDLTYSKLPIEKVDQLTAQYPLEDVYTLSPMQEGKLFYTLYNDSFSAGFMQMTTTISGELHLAFFKKSLNDLFVRYDILRTNFVYEDVEVPLQVILKEREVEFVYEDLREIDSAYHKQQVIKTIADTDRHCSFDLGKDILLRVTVLQTADNLFVVLWSYHHILMDGWCIGLLFREFLAIYNSYIKNETQQLPAVTPYRTYIQWLAKQDKNVSKHYWKKYLRGFKKKTPVPRKQGTTAGENGYRIEKISLELTGEKTAALNELAVKNQVTLNNVIQTIWGIILSKYNRNEDVVFGAVVSGRPSEIPGVEAMIGLFMNTVPVRVVCPAEMSFKQLVQQVGEAAISGTPYHHYPLARIQAGSILKRDLLDHIMVFENYPVSEQVQGAAGRDQQAPFKVLNVSEFAQPDYNFHVVVFPGNSLNLEFRFNTLVYDADFVRKIALHIQEVIDTVIENWDIRVGKIPISHESREGKSLDRFDYANDFGF